MAIINKEIAYMALPLSIRRGNPFPLDENSVWYDKAQMETYAQTGPTAYVGQILVYVNESENTVEAYVIQNAAGTLMKLAASTASGDLAGDVLKLQGQVSNLEALVGTKTEESTITAENLWGAIEEIKAAYELADTTINDKFNGYYTKEETDEKISAQISSTYKAGGSKTFEELPQLSATEEGKVYNISNEFTTNENFVEGAGQKYPAGTNVVCIDIGTDEYKWDVLSGFVDLSGYETTESITEKLNLKVDKQEGYSLVQDTLISKLQGLTEIKNTSEEFEIDPETKTLSVKTIEPDKINGLPQALAAKLTGVTIGTTPLEVVEGVVTIPIATIDKLGAVKSSNDENKVSIEADGTMTINTINIDKIIQSEGTEIVLNGGGATAVTE